MHLFINIIREISKLSMFAMLWGFPMWLASHTGNYYYLWFFALSAIFTMAMFAHYEDLERTDNGFYKQQKNDTGIGQSQG